MHWLVMTFFLFTQLLIALDTIESAIRMAGVHDLEELLKILKANHMATMVKVKAVRRVAEIYKENSNSVSPDIILSHYREALTSHNDDNPPHSHYLIRGEICSSLAQYASSPNASEALRLAQKQVQLDTHIEVKASCAQALGSFHQNPNEAGKSLLEILEQELRTEAPHEANIKLVMNLVHSLGRLKYRPAFVGLIKVLQSGYPASVKKEAEFAIRNLRSS
ncbi:MAG: hypothetical protein NZM25_10570 [Leptospiraceae bacterium]|nr:hypothetical protein [Leptospiraceae bacterium]MDW8305871.1 hypothetical protein [Leptospiraceae bacterium]